MEVERSSSRPLCPASASRVLKSATPRRFQRWGNGNAGDRIHHPR